MASPKDKNQYDWQIVPPKTKKSPSAEQNGKGNKNTPKSESTKRTPRSYGNTASNSKPNSGYHSPYNSNRSSSSNSYKNAAVHLNQKKTPVKRSQPNQRKPFEASKSDHRHSGITDKQSVGAVVSEDNENTTNVLDLPLEILTHILSYLKWPDQKACSLVCSDFLAASRWFRKAIRPSRYKKYEDLIAAYPRLRYVVLDSCTTAVPMFKECMSKLIFVNTLVLWNTPKTLLQGKFPPDDSPWKHTIRKVITDSGDPPPNIEWNFRNIEVPFFFFSMSIIMI
eukprot:TRINITY_DN3326_c0_g1_i3.p1 TRINITY_DN3326_c0_g1~~TRINITY_DN3326_c0_g1_i3.p1  ORF type:complete len:281 (+),score=26.86 TRINITY_DN3326_c0_g1_i3:233-1075(+)